ncbi:hypothetical protein GF337_13260 [candidate division KSB1 bacterium]|nr:hypothetical protein [candidate division KSB1 bacterium]
MYWIEKMLWQEITNIDSSVKELKKFGITVGIVLGVIGSTLLIMGKINYLCFLIPAALLLISAFIIPKLLLPFQKIWMTIAVILGWIMTRIILSVLFYLIVTPISIIAKLFGKQFLDVKWVRSQQSYWNRRERGETVPTKYENQF